MGDEGSHGSKRVAPIALFLASLVAAWTVGRVGWRWENWFVLQAIAGLVSLLLAGWFVLESRNGKVSIPLAFAALVVSNLGLVESAAMQLIWRFGRGIAP